VRDVKTKREKRKIINRFAVIYFAIIIFILAFPPITKLFDRNDIWIGVMPLSQFYILFFLFLLILGMGILYMVERKMEGGAK
jgi:hypothetical protein